MNNFHIIIPARFNSSRLPGKLLMKIKGKTILERVYHQALLARPTTLLIATDNQEIAKHAESFGADVVMTSSHHLNGTSRITEVLEKKSFNANDVIVNVQGDEPFIPPQLISQLADVMHQSDSPVATLCWPIETLEQFHNPNVVKVVLDHEKNALYFSRAPIPCYRDGINTLTHAYRHIGLYAYRAHFLTNYQNLPACFIGEAEALEQLSILYAGYKIQVEIACMLPNQDINTKEDLLIAEMQEVV